MIEIESAVDHLRMSREALLKQRQALDRAIADIDRAIEGLVDQPVPGSRSRFDGLTKIALPQNVLSGFSADTLVLDQVMVRASQQRQVPTVREAIAIFLKGQPDGAKAHEVIAGIRKLGVVAQDDAVRSILVKMLKAGQAERPAHGVYRLSSFSDSTASESVGLTTLSEESAHSREEVTNNGTTTPDHQDQALHGHDPDDRSGAPVVGRDLVAS